MKTMKRNYITFAIIIISFLFKYNNSYIVLPFKYRSFPKTNNLTEIVYNLVDNKLIITLPIGDPQTKIDFYASMNEYIYYLEEGSCIDSSSNSYYYSDSKSFSISNREPSYCPYGLDPCYLGEEKIYFYKDINLKDMTEFSPFLFYYGTRKNKNDKRMCGSIGFQIENRPYRIYEYENFITNLKKNSIIISYSWFIHYYDKPYKKNENEYYDGAIIFDILTNKFYEDFPYFKNNNDFYYVNAKDLERILAWTFTFDNIHYSLNDTRNDMENREVGLAFEVDFIRSSQEYFESILKSFFDSFLKDNICFLIEGKYSYIYCDKTKFQNNIAKFPVLYFNSIGLNKTFSLSGEDLFQEYNDNLLFMIILEKYSFKLWTLGKIFLKKYNFYFDNDKKIIGCFDDIKPKKEIKNFFNKIKWYIFILMGIIIGFIIGKKIRDKTRKLRANELEDKYEYLSNKANNKDNTNNISNYKEIKSQLYEVEEEKNN